jgi:hypothetical protein
MERFFAARYPMGNRWQHRKNQLMMASHGECMDISG